MGRRDAVLVTGATGALGTHVVGLLRERLPRARLLILARSPDAVSPPDGARVLPADLAAPDAGNPDLALAARDATLAVHMAADVRWNLPLREAVRVNALGTWRLLTLLRRSARRLRRVVYVSTTFAEAPSRCGSCRPFLRTASRVFSNSYELSKWIGERYVRRSGLPWTIVRPSLIVGDSRTGRIARYNGMYHLLSVMVRGRLPFLVGDPVGVVDMVPVDVAATAVVDSLLAPEAESRIVLACSASRAPTMREVADATMHRVNAVRRAHRVPEIPSPAYVSCDTYRRLLYPLMEPELLSGQRRFLQTVDLFHPYLGIPRGIAEEPGMLLYRADSFDTYADRFLTAWCEDHLPLVTAPQHVWSARRRSPGPDRAARAG